MKKVIQVLNSIVTLRDEDCLRLNEILLTKHLNKGDYWIEADKKNYQIAFIEEGYLRKFYNKDDKEITDFFYFENDFCADLPSIIANTNSQASIVAMQKTIVTTFKYSDFNALCQESPILEHLHRVIVELTFLRFYKRSVSFIMQTPTERYHDLMVTYPTVFQKATQYHIASYLGISAQHLSRLRGQHSIS